MEGEDDVWGGGRMSTHCRNHQLTAYLRPIRWDLPVPSLSRAEATQSRPLVVQPPTFTCATTPNNHHNNNRSYRKEGHEEPATNCRDAATPQLPQLPLRHSHSQPHRRFGWPKMQSEQPFKRVSECGKRARSSREGGRFLVFVTLPTKRPTQAQCK